VAIHIFAFRNTNIYIFSLKVHSCPHFEAINISRRGEEVPGYQTESCRHEEAPDLYGGPKVRAVKANFANMMLF
jgi:hypothetical protein